MSVKVNLPEGFSLATARAEIKGPELTPGRDDMSLIYSDREAAVAGVFTTNMVKAAPVVLNIERVRKGRARAVVVNSGNANACTGERGMKDALATATGVEKALDLRPESTLVCSTGVIGVPMPMNRVKPGLKTLAGGLGGASVEAAARAIMTTDTYPKYISREVKVGRVTGRITAICKGAGMIEPNMATMLCFIMTDLAVGLPELRAALKDSVADTFNMLTVDGDQSTSDSVLLMANGAIGNPTIKRGSVGYKRFAATLREMCFDLVEMIARDGEGATKLVLVDVAGARSEAQARKLAKAVANSLLVKTAIYGADPNWGRILPVLGRAGNGVNPDKVDIYIGKAKVCSKGRAASGVKEAEAELKKNEVLVRISLGLGKASARAITCDLTEEYIRINSEYTT